MVANIVVGAVVVIVVAAIVYFRVRARKMGKSSCGCDCSGCPSSGACHPK